MRWVHHPQQGAAPRRAPCLPRQGLGRPQGCCPVPEIAVARRPRDLHPAPGHPTVEIRTPRPPVVPALGCPPSLPLETASLEECRDLQSEYTAPPQIVVVSLRATATSFHRPE
ncbi:hypothetical protein PVAP13_6NG367075 [Panicum virgatum]|uniref:Uncharacterized protein n=1 Tax=Panicum virgatum TaxID=38727 RepID=A0A8T0R7C4_PANVG|nr:hypothetical protein PVAP13_6NG367075 [Panicum virgatum]